MSKKDEALKLALEALEAKGDAWIVLERKAKAAIREALADQPAQQEPVAYAVYHRMGGSKSLHWHEQHSPDGDANEYQLLPLYTPPPAQRTWVGLTEEEIRPMCGQSWVFDTVKIWVNVIEAKLREKNAQPSKPLTDEQIDRAIAELGLNYFADAANNRAVLRELCRKAAHGIKGDA